MSFLQADSYFSLINSLLKIMPQNNKIAQMTQKLAIWYRKTTEKFVFSWNLNCFKPIYHIPKGFNRPLTSTAVVSFPTMYCLSHGCRPFLFQYGQHVWFAVWIWGRSYERVSVVWTMPVVWSINIWCSLDQICCTGATWWVWGAGAGSTVCLSKAWLRQLPSPASKAAVCVQISLSYC